MDKIFILCLLSLFFPSKRGKIILRNLNHDSLTSLISVNFTSLIAANLDILDMFWIKNPTFYCWCAFPVFPFLSSHTLFQDSPLMMDLFTERPVNRAITTTSPSATACQRSHPSGIKSCVVSFLIPFLLSVSRRVISVHRDISHADSFSCQMDLWAPCNCLLPLRFSKKWKKTEFLHTCLLEFGSQGHIFCCFSRWTEENPTWNNQILCEECEGMLDVNLWEISPKTPNCSVDHCLCQRCKT